MVDLVTTFCEVANKKAALYDGTKKGEIARPNRPTAWFFVIPASYYEFNSL